MSDVQALNNQSLEIIKKTPLSVFNSRLEDVTVSLRDMHGFRTVLENNGLVVIPNYIPDQVAEQISNALDHVAEEAGAILSDTDCCEYEGVFFDASSGTFPTYKALASCSKPIVQVRQGQDQGMIDIFNVDKILKEFGEDIYSISQNHEMNSVIAEVSENAKPANINAYINKGVTKTRGFHVDSYFTQYKAFIYLEDVLVLDDGPYTYVLQSNEDSAYRRANQKLSSGLENHTECPLIDIEKVLPVLAPKGALVISDQSGFHRGFPQGKNGKRKALVMNYKKMGVNN